MGLLLFCFLSRIWCRVEYDVRLSSCYQTPPSIFVSPLTTPKWENPRIFIVRRSFVLSCFHFIYIFSFIFVSNELRTPTASRTDKNSASKVLPEKALLPRGCMFCMLCYGVWLRCIILAYYVLLLFSRCGSSVVSSRWLSFLLSSFEVLYETDILYILLLWLWRKNRDFLEGRSWWDKSARIYFLFALLSDQNR